MVSTQATMPRKKRSYALDERLIEAVQRAAKKANMSANRYLEGLIFSHVKAIGEIPLDAEPLGELRGGDFTSGRKKETGSDHKDKN